MTMVFWRVPRFNASFTEININKAIGEAVQRLDYTISLATENQANTIKRIRGWEGHLSFANWLWQVARLPPMYLTY